MKLPNRILVFSKYLLAWNMVKTEGGCSGHFGDTEVIFTKQGAES
jgi:hypothetical protein